MAEPIAAPFSGYRTAVRKEWIDYNGHLNDGCYGIVLSEANERMLAALDVSDAYRKASGRAMYTVEAHLRYLAEATLGQVLSAETMLVGADAKRLRLHTVLRHEDDRPVATGEYLYLHVHAAVGRTEPFPPEVRRVVTRVLAVHSTLERPVHLGLGVSDRSARRPS